MRSRKLPGLKVYSLAPARSSQPRKSSNHGAHFQYPEQFNRYAIDFLER
jgi:hypothetical protein